MKRATSSSIWPAWLVRTKADVINIETSLSGDMLEGLDRLADAAGEKALRSAGFAGAQVFQQEAILLAPEDTGVLKNNIIIKRAEEKSEGAEKQTYLVTVRSGKFNAEGDAFYWRFVEFGTSHAAARPFMRPAFESMKKAAIDRMRERLGEQIKEANSK